MEVGIIEAAIGAVGSVAAAYVGWKVRKQKSELTQATNELDLQKKGISFTSFINDWDTTYKELNDIFNGTEVDRFLILRAWNGSLDPKWTTAIYQMRQGNQEPVSYVHFEIDDDYVNRLIDMRSNKKHYLVVNEIEDSDIKDIYMSEGVHASLWIHLGDEKIGKDSTAITYCSFATTTNKKISKSTMIKCKSVANRLSGIIDNYNKVPR